MRAQVSRVTVTLPIPRRHVWNGKVVVGILLCMELVPIPRCLLDESLAYPSGVIYITLPVDDHLG